MSSSHDLEAGPSTPTLSNSAIQRLQQHQRYGLMEDDQDFHNIDLESIDRLSAALGPGRAPEAPQMHDIDGFYANLAVKPTEEEKLPTYTEAVSTGMPMDISIGRYNPYVNPWAADPYGVQTSTDEEEVLIEGMPVGPPILLMINALASMAFDLLGFLITFFLATTHAAKEGSKVGLGVTILRYGLFLQRRADFTAEGLSETDATLAAEGGAQEDWMTGNVQDTSSIPYGDDDGIPLEGMMPPKNSTNSTVTVPRKRKSRKIPRLPVNTTVDDEVMPSLTSTPTAPILVSATATPTMLPEIAWQGHGGGMMNPNFNPATYMVSSMAAYALILAGWLLIFSSITRYVRNKKLEEIARLGSTPPAQVSMPAVEPVPIVVDVPGVQLEEAEAELHDLEPNEEQEATEHSGFVRRDE